MFQTSLFLGKSVVVVDKDCCKLNVDLKTYLVMFLIEYFKISWYMFLWSVFLGGISHDCWCRLLKKINIYGTIHLVISWIWHCKICTVFVICHFSLSLSWSVMRILHRLRKVTSFSFRGGATTSVTVRTNLSGEVHPGVWFRPSQAFAPSYIFQLRNIDTLCPSLHYSLMIWKMVWQNPW